MPSPGWPFTQWPVQYLNQIQAHLPALEPGTREPTVGEASPCSRPSTGPEPGPAPASDRDAGGRQAQAP